LAKNLLTSLGDSTDLHRRIPPVVFSAGVPVREWFWPVAPVAAILYFTLYPDQFSAFVGWAERFIH
jgi:hypothetical protein